MTVHDNKQLVQAAFQGHPLFCSPEATKMRDFYADDFRFVGPSTELAALDACSDIEVELDELIAEDDRVVARWHGPGLHTAEFLGVAATGRSGGGACITIFRCADGRIAEGWGNIAWAD